MLSKSEIKELKSLHQKKYREKNGLFLAEGEKLVKEALCSGAQVELICATEEWDSSALTTSNQNLLKNIDSRTLSQICELRNPNKAVAICRLPANSQRPPLARKWHIYLDRVRDPGNLGTILRIADWYGMSHVFCSPDSVDPYNQKVIQASMGAIFRVDVITISESTLIANAEQADLSLCAAAMDGESIYTNPAPKAGVLMMGNEAQGLSDALLSAAQVPVTIPKRGQAESLNVAVATAILTDWIFRDQPS